MVRVESAIRTTARVLPGGRLEITAPGVRPGDSVDVIILSRPSANGRAPESPASGAPTVLDFIDGLPSGPRSAASWEAVEEGLRQERNSWDR